MKKLSIIEEKFSDAVRQYDMLSCRSLLVGLSGGADSVALLYLLKKEAVKRGFSLFALHVNHMIRGEEADRDENFCRDLCEKWDSPLKVIKADVPKIALETKTGVEEAARNCRYEAFEAFCRKNSVERIATAHNASDNLETVIFNLARGSSLKGLTGIPAVRGNIVRPLIYCTKKEILEYLGENNIEHVYDSTNSDVDYSRNLIRHKIVPKLLSINPSLENSLSKTVSLLSADERYLEKTASEFNSDKIEDLASLDKAILGRVIKNMYRAASCGGELSFIHVSDVEKLIASGVEHSSISLPCEVLAVIENSRLVFSKESERAAHASYSIPLKLGENIIDEDGSIIFICRENEENTEKTTQTRKYLINKQNIYKISIKASVSFDIINDSLYARSRKDGDRYIFGKMTRKVKKLFSEKKMPLDYRDTIPIIEAGENIVWIPGFPVCDLFSSKNNENSQQIAIYYMKRSL